MMKLEAKVKGRIRDAPAVFLAVASGFHGAALAGRLVVDWVVRRGRGLIF